MKLLPVGFAVSIVLLANSPGQAAFTINDPNKVSVTTIDGGEAKVLSLGSFATNDITVNGFNADNQLITASDVAGLGNFTSTLAAGAYEVFLVSGRNASTDSSASFRVGFTDRTVAGVIASNNYKMDTATNVWGSLQDTAILNAITTALNDAAFNPNTAASSDNRAATLDDIQGTSGDGRRAIEIIGGGPNPDKVLLNGNQLDYTVNTKSWGAEFSLVFTSALTAVPEPTTFAVWGLCAIGAVVAGRRRLRRLAV